MATICSWVLIKGIEELILFLYNGSVLMLICLLSRYKGQGRGSSFFNSEHFRI